MVSKGMDVSAAGMRGVPWVSRGLCSHGAMTGMQLGPSRRHGVSGKDDGLKAAETLGRAAPL